MNSLQAEPAKITIEISPEQADQIQTLFEITKALASPDRLAIIGVLAARLRQSLSVEELASATGLATGRMERDLLQLSEAGFITIEEWQTTKPGSEPVPARLSFNTEYLKLMPQLITVLAQLNRQVQPPEKAEPLDERAKTLGRFLKDGKLVGWPSQFKRQVYVIEEISKVFEPNRRYSEREIDNILKEIYEYDHNTLRRYLVDLNYLKRENGIYWKETNTGLTAV